MPAIKKKLGHVPFTPSPADLLLDTVLETPASPGDGDWGNYSLVDGTLYDFEFPWGMLANNKIGDCEVAGQMHGQMLDDAEGGRTVPSFSDKVATEDYSAIGGYEAGKPTTDQGLETRQTLAFRRRTGMQDVHGKRHKIGIFGRLRNFADLGEWDAVGSVTGKIAIGTAITKAAAAQFDRAEPFDLTTDDELDGYHFIYVVGRLAGHYVVSTWGTLALATPRYLQASVDEAWAYASGAQIDPDTGETLAGLDVEKARAYIADLEKESK